MTGQSNVNFPVGAAMAPPATLPVATSSVPPIVHFGSHYERYNGAIGQGANKTTHTAEVRFDGRTELAVVKAFALPDRGWLNEAVAWSLARSVGLPVPPRAAILVSAVGELASATEVELMRAHCQWGSVAPTVFWCASRLEVRPPQHAISLNWEKIILRGEAGQQLAAFDAWIGNCDRIADNAPYWVTRGLVAAIDHERMVFAQDWIANPPQHLDVAASPPVETRLIEKLKYAQKAGAIKSKAAKDIVAKLDTMSMDHALHFAKLRADLEAQLLVNVSNAARHNLVTFLEERCSRVHISKRLEVL